MSVKAVQSKGSVTICSLSKLKDVPKDNNYCFMTTRGKRTIKGVRQSQELAPSSSLFKRYLNEWKGTSLDLWWPEYKEIYLRELDYSFIDKLTVGLNEGKNITLICFCGPEVGCHRSILKEIFSNKGFEIITY